MFYDVLSREKRKQNIKNYGLSMGKRSIRLWMKKFTHWTTSEHSFYYTFFQCTHAFIWVVHYYGNVYINYRVMFYRNEIAYYVNASNVASCRAYHIVIRLPFLFCLNVCSWMWSTKGDHTKRKRYENTLCKVNSGWYERNSYLYGGHDW